MSLCAAVRPVRRAPITRLQLISTLLPLFSQDQPRAAQIPTILYLMEILIWMDVLTLLKPGPVKLNEMY